MLILEVVTDCVDGVPACLLRRDSDLPVAGRRLLQSIVLALSTVTTALYSRNIERYRATINTAFCQSVNKRRFDHQIRRLR